MSSPLMLFAGSRVGDFVNPTGTIYEQSGQGAYDSNYSDCATVLNSSVQMTCPFTDASGSPVSVVAGQKISVHAWIAASRSLFGGCLTLLNSSSQAMVRIDCPSQGYVRLQYNSNTGSSPVWTNLGPQTAAIWGDYDISLDIGSSGTHTILFAVDSSTIYNGTFTNSNLTEISSLLCINGDGGSNGYFSQVMAARDMGLVGAKLKTLRATGAGTYSQWTGGASQVNEVVTSDSTYDVTATADQIQSYNMTDITLPAQYSVASVYNKFRIRNDGGASSAPQNVQGFARSGGTDYTTGNLSGVAAAYGYVSTRYDVDPSTGTAWTQSGVNSLELGYKSKT